MIVRTLEKLEGTERDVSWGNGRSRRFLIKADGRPYSVTDTTVNADTSSFLQYRNHVETCYRIAGKGRLRNHTTGETHVIVPGTIYSLDKNDAHHLIADQEGLRLICVFYPNLNGDEVHHLSSGGRSSAY
ncbi:L-ectoine synthase 2 (plasmid) [Rhizobium etli]|uniref:L-ectoine synthase n=1 Tax=Rhizobium etli TaxID=29449 RepID=A0AAN1BLP6_RHIET|nr:ectoine synthase [Rhizobium etli]ARQ13311.1 L-ectoine synthase 2 [Rhizobium etli]